MGVCVCVRLCVCASVSVCGGLRWMAVVCVGSRFGGRGARPAPGCRATAVGRAQRTRDAGPRRFGRAQRLGAPRLVAVVARSLSAPRRS